MQQESIEPTSKDEQKFKTYLQLRYSPSTINQYFKQYKKFVKEYGLKAGQEEINHFMITYVYGTELEPKSNNPFYKGFITSIVNCFKIKAKIPKSHRKGQHDKKKKYKFLTKQEVDLLINKLEQPFSLVIRLMFETGLRLRELVHCHTAQIDLENRTIVSVDQLEKELKRVVRGSMGKGNKSFKVKFSTKTANLLDDYLLVCKNEHYPFFLGRKNTKDQGRSFYNQLLFRCKKLGFTNIHPHRIRHSLGHFLRADAGFDLEQIRVKLRHARLETTQIYTVATDDEVDDLIDKKVFHE
jgi:integrase